MTTTLRQKTLILAVAALTAFNAWYFYSRWKNCRAYVVAEWVAYMPDLEMRQRNDESQLLYSFHHWDPAYPYSYIIKDNVAYPLFSKIAHGCKVREYAISKFIGPTSTLKAHQMPDRLFVGALNTMQIKCLRNELPEGYVLAKLSVPIRPHAVGWAEGDLQFDSDRN